MKFENVYFITGTAYAGKSTMVKMLAEKYGGIECGENYHDVLLPQLSKADFPCLTYTRDLVEWRDFVVRTPDEYERWVDGVSKECEILEMQILEGISDKGRPVFVDTNISLETLHRITCRQHVLVMLAEPCISVSRFFDRPDKEKQFLYQLLMAEEDPEKALDNFRQCLMRINSPERNERFANSGFTVICRDENRTPAETLLLAEKAFGLNQEHILM